MICSLVSDAAIKDQPGSYGLYKSNETPSKLANASDLWRNEAGIIIERDTDSGVSQGKCSIIIEPSP